MTPTDLAHVLLGFAGVAHGTALLVDPGVFSRVASASFGVEVRSPSRRAARVWRAAGSMLVAVGMWVLVFL